MYSTHYGTRPVMFIKVFTFDDGLDVYAGLVGLVMSAKMSFSETTAAGNNVYSGFGEFNWTTKYDLEENGKDIMEGNIGAMLEEVISLGFTLDESHYVADDAGNYYIGQYSNEDDYVVQIILFEDESGYYAGYYQVLVIAPAE